MYIKSHCKKTFLFQAIPFSQAVLLQLIQFSRSADFLSTQFNVQTVLNRFISSKSKQICYKKILRWPGVEPGSTAWKATMLTVTPPTLGLVISF